MAEANAAERRLQTMQFLKRDGHASVSRLSEYFGVSEVTVRKDLRALEDENLVVRTHGGAILEEHFKFDLPFDKQSSVHAEEKLRIGAAAAALVEDRDAVILSTGSTTAQVARHLVDKQDLTVITHSLRIASDLLGKVHFNLYLLGGQVLSTTAATVGPYAEDMLRDHAAHKVFLGADGYDLDHGLTTTNMLEAHLQRRMIEASQMVIVVSDASKFDRRGVSRVCTVSNIDVLVTDSRIPEHYKRHFEEAGVSVVIADASQDATQGAAQQAD